MNRQRYMFNISGIKSMLSLFTFFSIFSLFFSFSGRNSIWELKNSGTTAGLRGISVVNKNIVWASGNGGTVLRTINGGKDWERKEVRGAKELDFRDIEAFGENTAYILSAGKPAKIYKTTDGGKNWIEQYSNNTQGIFFNSMAFWDMENGIAVGDPINGSFMIIHTENGGKTWNQVPAGSIPSPITGEAQFAASGTCITVNGEKNVWFCTGGSAARVFRSEDSGKTWEVSGTPIICGESSKGIFSIAFLDVKNGIIVGGDYRNPDNKENNAAITTDGGVTWKLIKEGNQPAGFRSCAVYISWKSGTALLAVGPTGTDISENSGKTWVNIDTTGFHTMDVSISDGSCWAAGSDGRIARLNIK